MTRVPRLEFHEAGRYFHDFKKILFNRKQMLNSKNDIFNFKIIEIQLVPSKYWLTGCAKIKGNAT